MNSGSALNARQMNEQQMLSLINAHAMRGAARQRTSIGSLLGLWWSRALERRQMRRDLEAFTDAVLEDFSMTRTEAIAEAGKPFWRA
ncbi:hypothetical protein [uncultured Cohaesibacter sp.]|uniref:DUF1127 domain-containing protein n=1 Tax=uncultured Cohaesibacter sp. TaxID=1002546 RepID=UPI0029C7B1A2|nr:hypothetical protein [uncultured Cohaesibacter sp.]